MRIYLAHPISGLDTDTVFNYYDTTTKMLKEAGFEVLSPMYGKDELRTDIKFRAVYDKNPVTTNSAIVNRDLWMVKQSDIVFLNFTRCEYSSIGIVAELTTAYLEHKLIITVLPEVNPNRHAFIIEMSGTIFTNENDAFEYLKILGESL